MATDKNKILVYKDWKATFDKLTDDEAGRLIKHFFAYVNDDNPTAPDRITEIAFEPIKQTLKRDLKKWEAKAEISRDNGSKGGRPLKPTETQNNPVGFSETQDNPQKPVSVTVSVSDSVTVSDNLLLEKEAKERLPKKKQVFIPPSLTEVIAYFKDNGYNEQLATKAFNYYNTASWQDSGGKPVRNWKQKMIANWFKEENKSSPTQNTQQIFNRNSLRLGD